MALEVSALGTTEWKDLDVAKLVLLTGLATILENAVMYPFWVLKTNQQVSSLKGDFLWWYPSL
jgi:hypothetical protein